MLGKGNAVLDTSTGDSQPTDQRWRHGHKNGHRNGTAKSRRRLPIRLGGLGSVVSSPAGSVAESQPLANFVHFISYFMHSEAKKFRFSINYE